MKILEINIERYGPLPKKGLTINPSFQCIYGPNESGKTLLIDAFLKMSLGKKQPKKIRDQLNRVEEDPKGWILVQDGNSELIIDGSTLLTDVVNVSGDEIRDIFIIRNSDLAFLDEKRCLGRLTERILNLRTKDINLIQNRICERGGITAGSGVLVSAGGDGSPARQISIAKKLVEDIDEYLESAEDEGIEESERVSIDLAIRIAGIQSEIEQQKLARKHKTKTEIESALQNLTGYMLEEKNLGKDTRKEISETIEDYEESKSRVVTVEREIRLFGFLSIIGAIGLVLSVLLSIILQVGQIGITLSAIMLVLTVFSSLMYLSRMKLVKTAAKLGQDLVTLAAGHNSECQTERNALTILKNLLERAEEFSVLKATEIGKLQNILGTNKSKIEFLIQDGREKIKELRGEIGNQSFKEFNEHDLEEKEKQLKEIKDELKMSSDRLKEHRRKLEEFENRVAKIKFEEYLHEAIVVVPDSLDSLRKLRNHLLDLEKKIEGDADVARTAIVVFDKLLEEEEEKVSELLSEGSTSAGIFNEITDGDYIEVKYVPDEKKIIVVDRDGQEFAPEDLSKGTKDQLYLSIRVGVGEKLLEGKQGFFIMDDPFIASDLDRTERQREILKTLVTAGWQIIFLTARKDLAESLSTHFGEKYIELESLR
jgi:hypothetical protein